MRDVSGDDAPCDSEFQKVSRPGTTTLHGTLNNGRLGSGLKGVGQTTSAAVLAVLVEGHLPKS